MRSQPPAPTTVARLGIVVHPVRTLDAPLGAIHAWAARRGVDVLQVGAALQQREVAPPGDARKCDLIVSVGGDGTTLAALRAGAVADRPVLGVACGSLGVLTTTAPDDVEDALERFCLGDWVPRLLPALDVVRDQEADLFALNDIVLVRSGPGQLRLTVHVDGSLFVRLAGDGCIVSTASGASGYALSAGGPLLMPTVGAFLLTQLASHGGFSQPLVVDATSELALSVAAGYGGVRLEVDGQSSAFRSRSLTVTTRRDVATLVGFSDQEPLLPGLRRRQIIVDSPRMLAGDDRGLESVMQPSG